MCYESCDKRVLMILDYIVKAPEQISSLQGYDFDQKSFLKWAASELVVYFEERKVVPPLIVLEEFADKMDRYSHLNPNGSLIFSLARSIAEYIIDLLIN